ncbi:hypothetical protein Pmani_011533 [Petrolisthes manimaculis]|uniref:Uncharacterized protein n=1 Tax=Petrolisthes manimaculis TaxID=1843537 RepID=A0AAE1PZA2_9EUCA|nr:hypothetical protein Pmani_011533 [Petrolisthes manimaculis]
MLQICKRNAHLLSQQKLKECISAASPSTTSDANTTQYQSLTVPRTIPTQVPTHLHRLRLGYKCKGQILNPTSEKSCSYCDVITILPLLHYILDCHVTVSIRQGHHDLPHHTAFEASVTASHLISKAPITTLVKVVTAYHPPR